MYIHTYVHSGWRNAVGEWDDIRDSRFALQLGLSIGPLLQENDSTILFSFSRDVNETKINETGKMSLGFLL
jgi:hypothetical protein